MARKLGVPGVVTKSVRAANVPGDVVWKCVHEVLDNSGHGWRQLSRCCRTCFFFILMPRMMGSTHVCQCAYVCVCVCVQRCSCGEVHSATQGMVGGDDHGVVTFCLSHPHAMLGAGTHV